MAGKGIQHLILRIPDQWDPVWFERVFIREVLANMDTRNAVDGLGISVTGNSNEPATISGSADLAELFDAGIVLAAADPLLPNARVLKGMTGVIQITDSGAGGTVEVDILPNAVGPSQLATLSALSVLCNATNATANMQYLTAAANDTLLTRVGDALDFTQLTVDMAPDGLWTGAKLATAVQTSLGLADTSVQTARAVDTGTGLTGGGDLSSDRTIELDAGSIASLALADSSLQPGYLPILPAYTVATLPSAATYAHGMAMVTDATATAITGLGIAPVGGGANKVPVYSDGTNWLQL